MEYRAPHPVMGVGAPYYPNTEQEKKSGGSSGGGSSVVMMEQSATSRHKPFRPTDLQEDAQELHHKRSKAPAVPSVTEDFKESSENQDRRELERAMSSEKQKHNAAKKLSSNTKRRDSSPETIALANVDLETKKGTVSPIPKSVPAGMGAVSSTAFKLAEQQKSAAEKKGDEDSITEEIAESRTTDVAKESEWENENKDMHEIKLEDGVEGSSIEEEIKSTHGNLKAANNDSHLLKKKEITWYDGSYLTKGQDILEELGSRSKSVMLERKVSVGPCFSSGLPFGEPSGITICVPKKSLRTIGDFKSSQSGICITVSGKGFDKTPKSGFEFVRGDRVKFRPKDNLGGLKIEEVPYAKCLDSLKGKFGIVYGKIKKCFA